MKADFTPSMALGFASLCGVLSVTIWTAARVYVRRLEVFHREGGQRIDTTLERRLERIEQAVDTIAVEVERIAEGQRFTTRLLADGASVRPSVGGVPPRTNTPH